MKNIVFTGGGTGGHIYPGLAIVDEFKKKLLELKIDGKSPEVNVVWIGSKKGSDRDIVENVQVYLDTKSPYSYSIETTVKVICENEELRTLAFSLWEEYGWDVGIIKNCYQYTSNKSLKEIIPDIDKVKYDEFIKSFNEKAYVIIKQ